MKLFALLPFLLFGAAGCMISEQEGRLPQDLVFHFDNGFNYFIVILRVGVAAGVGWWVASGWKKSERARLLAWALYGFAGLLLLTSVMTLFWYRVDVRKDGLFVQVPPRVGEEIPWERIEGFAVEGQTWANELDARPGTPAAFQSRGPTYELPEWHRMEIVLASGETLEVNLKKLSVEQRQNLWKGIASHGRLTQTR